ncbi:MAG: hypothetical protein H0X63_10400 [Flavobacteriales bacterium]|nr:hypothetical protein [Flavobacteriales bacterium]
MKTIITTTILVLFTITLFAQNPPDFIMENGIRYDRVKTQDELMMINGMQIHDYKKIATQGPNGQPVFTGAEFRAEAGGKGLKTVEKCGGKGFACCGKVALEFTQGKPRITGTELAESCISVPPQAGKHMFYNKTEDELIFRQF